jgi:hypothetical protein
MRAFAIGRPIGIELDFEKDVGISNVQLPTVVSVGP